jgi:hypothetical protein
VALDENSEFAYDDVEMPRGEDERDYCELLRSVRSTCGFLAPGESLRQRVQMDADDLKSLNTDAKSLAGNLRAVLLASHPRTIDDTRPVSTQSGLFSSYNSVTLMVTRIVTRGQPQRSPFVNLDVDHGDSVWQDEFSIVNRDLKPSVTLKIGGNAAFGSIEMIEKYGFFGGGDLAAAIAAANGAREGVVVNDFRLDPHLIMAVLTGRWNDKAKQLVSVRKSCCQRVILRCADDREIGTRSSSSCCGCRRSARASGSAWRTLAPIEGDAR